VVVMLVCDKVMLLEAVAIVEGGIDDVARKRDSNESRPWTASHSTGAKQWSSNKEKETRHAKRDAMQAITQHQARRQLDVFRGHFRGHFRGWSAKAESNGRRRR